MCFNNNIFLIKKITKYNNNIPYFYFKLNGIFSGAISHHSNICLRTKSYRFKVVKKIKNKNKHSIILKRIYIYAPDSHLLVLQIAERKFDILFLSFRTLTKKNFKCF